MNNAECSLRFIWRPLSLSELTPTLFNMELTHLGSKASIWVLWIVEKLDIELIIFTQKLVKPILRIKYLNKTVFIA